MRRLICIHGHFYQPPRENPWTGEIDRQDSARPYHDWNERITAECYAPNTAARILDARGRTIHRVCNYRHISFDFGPTLLSWMQTGAAETYSAVIDADHASCLAHAGHGGALAQAYGHAILPLCNSRDLRTQVRWGVRDFEHRFGRAPEGMWLPETAVDLSSLDALAEHGLRYTVLAPTQAARVRPLDDGRWSDTPDGSIEPRLPYRLELPSGRSIALFFYDGPLSRAVAFDRLLESGERFAERLLGRFTTDGPETQLVHIATDGETYGHHHAHGDMALARAIGRLTVEAGVRLTTYGELLEQHPPQHAVEIHERTSWSCAHGIDRWAANCGCATGDLPGNLQQWRAPLRRALDWLRDAVASRFERNGLRLLRRPWEARDDSIELWLDRSQQAVDAFLARNARRALSTDERAEVLDLMELQRHALLMYASCGWFFDDPSRIETLQLLMHAGRVVELAERLFGEPLEAAFLERLARVESNHDDQGDGRRLYERFVLRRD